VKGVQQQKRESVSADNTKHSKTRPHIPTDSRQARQIARRQLIAEFVMGCESVRIDEISRQFGVSLMTAHRDIDTLVGEGVISKTRGIISAKSSNLSEETERPKKNEGRSDAVAIAAAAANLIAPGQTIFLDNSPIVGHIVPYLESKVPLTVITNSLDLMNGLRGKSDITLVGLGGHFKPWSGGFDGPQTLREISEYEADAVLVSADAIADGIACYQAQSDVEVRQAMLENSARKVLLANHSLFDKKALHHGELVSRFDTVVVNSALSSLKVDKMLSRKINVVLV
jgi:DeoR/GlpR family transcriptional regulator of sugar metabolism